MPATTTPLTGDVLLAGVTDATVTLHQHYHHRKPVTAKTTLLGGDLLACVLGGVYTDVEMTMIELERSTVVQETRSAFQTRCNTSSSLPSSGCRAAACWGFISNHHVRPDMEIELFLLQPSPDEPSAATESACSSRLPAHSQLWAGSLGRASGSLERLATE